MTHLGKPLDKIGQRALNQGEIFFDGPRVPAVNLVVPPEAYALFGDVGVSHANSECAPPSWGWPRRPSSWHWPTPRSGSKGGVPIFEHQSVKARLFEMFRKVESTRALNRRVVEYNAVNPPKLQYANELLGLAAAARL